MNIIEVKNNLVKICYEEELTLSGLVQINDIRKSYIAQILHLESTRVGKFAIAKIIFNYNNNITAYDGTVPSLRSEVKIFESANLLNSLKHDNPLILGKLAGQENNIVVDLDMLNENPIILSEKFHTTKTLMGNIALQLQARNKKLVIFDTAGIFNYGQFSLTKDFKLPLNESGINYIYEKEFADATEESKALIQSIFEELSSYSKTVEFIPFDTFKSVVDSEFMQTKLIQLVILKNRIKQIKDMNVYAQNKSEFSALKSKLESDNIVVVDISKVKDSLKYEAIKYTYSLLNKIDSEFYAFTPVSTESADTTLLNKIRETHNVHTTIICDYDYACVDNLKKNSKNMIMYTPLKQQHDFGGYNIFMQRLAEDEFIAYGKMTKFIPLIGKMSQLNPDDIVIPEENETPNENQEQTQPTITENYDEITIQEEEVPAQPETIVETPVPTNENHQEGTENEPIVEPTSNNTLPEVEEIKPTMVEEIPTPEVNTIEKPEIDISEMASATAEVVQQGPAQPIEQNNEVQDALNQVPDYEEDDELSDDDLDMIEKLSKPNEDISAINEKDEVQTVENEIPQETNQVQQEFEPAEQQNDIVENINETIQEPEPTVEDVIPEDTQELIQEQQQTTNESIVEEEVKEAKVPQQSEPLQTRANSTPSVPEYSAEFPDEDKVNSDPIQQGDRVFHQEFGEGVVEKLINYGDKVLCSVNFSSVGRRLLNPEISEMKRI